MQKMRIAVMAHEFDNRPERTLFFRRLIEHLIESDEVELTLVHAKPMPDEPLYKKTREVILPRTRLLYASRFFGFLRYCLTTKDEYDIVHWLKPRVFPFFWLFPARRIVIMVHGGGDITTSVRTFSRRIFNYTMVKSQKHVDALIAVSDYANKEIIYAYRVPPEKVVTIYNAVDEVYLRPGGRDTSILQEHSISFPYFLSMGASRPHKNIQAVIESYLEYRRTYPETREHLVLGGDTRAAYERAFGALPQSPFVQDMHFIDYVPTDHMPTFYRKAAALVFLSLNEGFGLPIVEAFACGTPVIGSNATAVPEIIGTAGIVVDPFDRGAVARAMYAVVSDPRLRERLIREGIARSKLFTWDNTFSQVLDIYHKVLARATN